MEFVEKLIADKQDLPALYADTCKLPQFSTNDGVESRAVGTFALIGMAGELATDVNGCAKPRIYGAGLN